MEHQTTALKDSSYDPTHCATNELNYNDTVSYHLSLLQKTEHSENRTGSRLNKIALNAIRCSTSPFRLNDFNV